MASWTALLLAALLSSPGLAFSGLTPECCDPGTSYLCDEEQLCQRPAQEGSQGELWTTGKGQGLITCGVCRMIMLKLQKMVGEQPDQNSITQALSRVCKKMRGLAGLCKKVMKSFLKLITRDMKAGKNPYQICEDMRLCKPEAGLM